MPIMSGVDLIAKIRKEDHDTIVIVLSAHNESRLLQTLINLDTNTFINKLAENTALIRALYRNCAIINDRKLVKEYAQQLEEENEAIRRKNLILEQKLKQLASQRNQNTKQHQKTEQTSSQAESYFATLLQDDKDELRDLSEELDTYIMMMFQNESLNTSYISKLSSLYKKYAAVLNTYPEFYDISSYIHNFAEVIPTLEEKFFKDIAQTGVYFESLHMTLETFRQNIWEKEAKYPKFYNASLKTDIQMVIDFLTDNEVEENEIEFF